jgi:hypothetical protein
MAADETTRIDNALIPSAGEAPYEREVRSGRHALGQLRGAFEEGEQDGAGRRLAAATCCMREK